MKPESEPLDDPFGWRAHDKQVPEHSGLNGHYCNEFDGLWICQDCSEWDCCTCFGREDMRNEKQAVWILYASDVVAEISSISSDDAWLKAEKRRGLPRGLLQQSGWRCVPMWISPREELGITTEPSEILGVKPGTIGVLNDE